MQKLMMKKAAGVMAVFVCLSLVAGQSAFAWDGGRGDRGARGGHEDRGGRGGWGESRHEGRYHYRGGRWYRSGWMGFDIAVAALTIGAIVESLPSERRVVYVERAPYYYYGGYYYRTCPAGYVVVNPPVIATPVTPATPVYATPVVPVAPVSPVVQAQAAGGESIVINVPNRSGSYTPVTLIKYNNGYIGPQGEYYENPTVDQLKVLYGK